MAHILLSGGGNAAQTKKLDKLLVSLIPKQKRMLYIPIAMPKREHSFKECFVWITNTFKKLKFNRIDMWTKLSGRGYKELNKYGAVYIGGGNTFSLLKQIRKSKFDKLLLKYIKHNGIVYGGSAGAILLGKSIGTAKTGRDSDENKVGLKNLKGLNVTKGYAIACHYTKADDAALAEYAKKNNTKVIALPQDAGAYLHNGNRRIIGPGKGYRITSKGKFVLKNS